MTLLQEIQEATKVKQAVNENAGCSMENEEQKEEKAQKSKKPRVPQIVKTLKDKFKDPSALTAMKVKNAIKAEFKKEAFSLEKEEWEKMSKDEQAEFVKAVMAHLNK